MKEILLSKIDKDSNPGSPTMRAADLVVGRAKKQSPSESIFRFDGWFSHQAANASRWTHTSQKEAI